MAEKEYKEIDITSLDSELAAAKAVEDGRKDKFIKIATIVAIAHDDLSYLHRVLRPV